MSQHSLYGRLSYEIIDYFSCIHKQGGSSHQILNSKVKVIEPLKFILRLLLVRLTDYSS